MWDTLNDLENKLYSINTLSTKKNIISSAIQKISNNFLYWDTKLLNHSEFLDQYFIWWDQITKRQKQLLQSLWSLQDNKKNIIISKWGIKAKKIRKWESAWWYVNIESKTGDQRNILINANYGKNTEQMLYTHEFVHHFVGKITNEEVKNHLSNIVDKINQSYNHDLYNKIKKQISQKYPQHSFYTNWMDYYWWTNIDELIAETYSNPVFREYLKTVNNTNNQNTLEEVNEIMNKYYWNWEKVFS